MRSRRAAALLVGAVFGCLNLLIFIAETYQYRRQVLAHMGLGEIVIWICGPITLLVATWFGSKHQRIAGWWLISGGLVTAALLAVRLNTRSFLIALLILSLPMLIAGWLWLTGGAPGRRAS